MPDIPCLGQVTLERGLLNQLPEDGAAGVAPAGELAATGGPGIVLPGVESI
jgi:hypothetical protein